MPDVTTTHDPRLLRRLKSLAGKNVGRIYSRDLHKWVIVAPVLGVAVGLLVTLIAEVILNWTWRPLLARLVEHPWAMVPVVTLGMVIAGLLMQFATPDPDEHSTEEIIRSYHERQGAIQMRPLVPKLLAAIATVGLGGSAALEGPSIYGGGALGSWFWTKLHRFGFTARDRRILLICGAAAGMGAVFRAPLTGLVFAMEMPYKDDLAHEALLPSLLSAVAGYATLAAFLGTKPLFEFAPGTPFHRLDLIWAVLFAALCGLVTLGFDLIFRRFRRWMVQMPIQHWLKMAAGGILTGLCGWGFILLYPGSLVPLGPNYDAVGNILSIPHSALELTVFGVLKLAGTVFTLGVGGVSAMFVPLFLTGGSFGAAFARLIPNASPQLFAAVGMAAFIAGGYKTPLTAAVFVAEATGAHAYLVPALLGAAVAYAVSGDASVSGDQHLNEQARLADLHSDLG